LVIAVVKRTGRLIVVADNDEPPAASLKRSSSGPSGHVCPWKN
jgi:hypothetical protein